MPPRSINAPKSAMFLTTPFLRSPTWIFSSSSFFCASRFSSSSFLRETTMLRRCWSIFNILQSIVAPTNSPMSGTRRMLTCDAGKNTGTPISTSNPPLILRITLPRTTSSSLQFSMIRSQDFILSAFRFERTIRPASSSTASRRTSTSSPTSTLPGSSNSERRITPSDLYPTSRMTLSSNTLTTFPLRTVPALKSFMDSSYTARISSGVPSPIALRTSSSISRSVILYSVNSLRFVI